MNAITFMPAQRVDTSLLIGLAGPSKSGKTYSALKMARGLAPDGPIYVIDTESNKAKHYAEEFDFLHGNLTAPFTSERYREAIQVAQAQGAKVIIVDSISHEHEGPGGMLEYQETEMQRLAGDDYNKRDRVKFLAWVKPKSAHNRFVNAILQINVHFIFCFRAKEKLALVKNAKGKQEPVPLGWQPICSDRFEYEMTARLMLPEGAKGVPNLDCNATQLDHHHQAFFPPGEPLSEKTGAALARWAVGSANSSQNLIPEDLIERADAVADDKQAKKEFWQGLSTAEKQIVTAHFAKPNTAAASQNDGETVSSGVLPSFEQFKTHLAKVQSLPEAENMREFFQDKIDTLQDGDLKRSYNTALDERILDLEPMGA